MSRKTIAIWVMSIFGNSRFFEPKVVPLSLPRLRFLPLLFGTPYFFNQIKFLLEVRKIGIPLYIRYDITRCSIT